MHFVHYESTAPQMSSSNMKTAKKNRKDQIDEILENQNHILKAVRNLNERLEVIEEKVDEEKMKDLKDIREIQSTIDEVVVKTSDDVALIKKQKEENKDAIKLLESKIEILNKEIQMRGMEPNPNKVYTNQSERKDYAQRVCKYYNRGFCRNRTQCWNLHAENICKIFLKEGKCFQKDCASRHPYRCKYFRRGCKRGNDCVYLHQQKNNDCLIENEIISDTNAHENNDYMEIDKNVDISENKKDEVIVNEGYLESNEEVEKQNKASDESNEIHVDEECECGKPNKKENFKCDVCGKIFCDKCPDAPIGENCLPCMIIASGL